VDAASTAPTPDGQSWATAFPGIQAAVGAAFGSGGGEVWVKEGTYTSTTGPVVTMKATVHLYGGFAGTETSRAERDWGAHVAVIDGENARRGVWGAGDATLDGFTVQNGKASLGGGMRNASSSPTVTNCTFSGNTADCGGGMYNSESSPIVTNCVFSGNAAADDGGGMFNSSSSPIVTNCAFSGNTANRWGGGIHNDASSPTVVNCTFSGNKVFWDGGGMFNQSGSPTVTNCKFLENMAEIGAGMCNESCSPTVSHCTFSGNGNTAISGGGMYNGYSSVTMRNCTFSGNKGAGMTNWSSSGAVTNCTFVCNIGDAIGNRSSSKPLKFTNCIVWGNSGGISGDGPNTVTYSCVQGGYVGDGNIDADPLFWNAAVGDVRLHPASPCLDSGTSSGAPAKDQRGVTRPQGAGVDMGAYEMFEPDTDGDGLMDEFEATWSHTDPNDPDSDGDGTNDRDEWYGFRTYYVDASSVAPIPDGECWNTAFSDIQTAVDRAWIRGGGEIWVAQGTYSGTGDEVVRLRNNVHLYGGFAGTETSRAARDWSAHVTAIDGENARCCVVGADDATLDGFTAQNGTTSLGGGMRNASSSPTVTNCTFTANAASDSGGGMYNQCSSPTVTNCVFVGNTAYDGGGMCNQSSSPTVINCTFSGNTAYDGGGMFASSSSPTVINCTFSGNAVSHDGGGMFSAFSSSPTLVNCTFSENTAHVGVGGIHIENSTVTVTNSIVWGNGTEISGSATVSYSCVQGSYPGVGNTDADPLFWWKGVAADLRLHPYSPCLDSGASAGAPATDLRGVARPQGSGVDMGAYEMIEVDTDGDGLMDEFETTWSHTDPHDPDSDGDGTGDREEWFRGPCTYYVDASSSSPSPDGESWSTAYSDIQMAVDRAWIRGGGEVWVARGTYTGTGPNAVILRNAVHLYGGFTGTEASRVSRDWSTHVTTIDGEDARRCVLGADDATLDGFTVQNGNGSPYGGGIYNEDSSLAVSNCTFSGNTALVGGGMHNSSGSPAVSNCTFSGNTATSSGGGMYNGSSSSPTVTNCTFSGNTATSSGGGMYNSSGSPAVSNCMFSRNTASSGAGMENFSCSPAVSNCTFSRNTATQDGGGMYNYWTSRPTLVNCTFSGNEASSEGGGMYNNANSRATLVNCTFSGNTASDDGGGIFNYSCWPTLINCILWGNSSEIAGDGSPTVTYSCIEGGYAGTGNIDADPLLGSFGSHGGAVDTYPIGTFSPARDSGVRCFLDVGGTLFYEIPGGGGYATADGASYVPSSTENELTTTDARGVPRPEGPGIDMGAHEFVPGAEGELLVISPNGGEQWGCGTTQTITWENALDDAGATVRLGLEKGGEFVDWIVRQTDNDGAHNWIVWTDLVPADDYALRVQSYTNNTYRDLSNAPFSILPITVRVPNGGETWTMGNVYVVDWVSNPTAVGADVRIGLHFGTDFLYWINRQTANDGQYFWKAPTDLAPGYGYRIRVQSYGDATIKDLSDAPFTLELPTLLWTSPDFHDELTAGQTYAVTWVCNDMGLVGSDVRIALHKGGAFIDWMTRKTENDGAWDWTVPLGLSPAPSYRLRLQSYTDKNVRAMSPAFTISAP